MNRMDLRQLAEDRIGDAALLLAGQRWSGAYYLSGYAVECELKACILAHVERSGAIFEDKKFGEKCWTHNLETLMDLANLDIIFANTASAALLKKWQIANEWEETSRYQQKPQVEAEKLYRAITDNNEGVLPWIRFYW